MRNAAGGAHAGRRARHAARHDRTRRRARVAAFAASAAASPPCPSGRPGADDARADRADARRRSPAPPPRRAPTRRRPHCASPPNDARRDRRLDQAARLQRAHASPRAQTGNAPPASWTYATRTPAARPPRAGATCDVAASSRRRASRPGSPPARRPPRRAATACCTGVYGSVITCAPGAARDSSPRVRFACRTSKPPEPSPSSRACTFTSTSSPSATGPVSRG